MIDLDQPFELEWRKVVNSTCLQRALWALGELGKPATPAEIAKCINARTPFHWAAPGCAKYFRVHFRTLPISTLAPRSPYFVRTRRPIGGKDDRSKFCYALTLLGEKLLQRMKTKISNGSVIKAHAAVAVRGNRASWVAFDDISSDKQGPADAS